MKGLIRSLSRGSGSKQAIRRQRVKVTAKAIQVDGASGVGWGTVVIGDLPEGNIMFFGAAAYMQFTKASGATGIQAAFDGDYAIGSAPASSASLASTVGNFIGSSALGAATSGVSPVVRGTGATAVMLDNTDGSLEINLSLLIDDANINADDQDLTVTGVVDLVYSVLLDD